jgi:serine/threonine protein kinase
MIEMATGKPPWMEIPYQNQMMLMVHISKSIKPPKLPESLSDGARDFLSKCLQVKPEERWNVRKLLQHPWMVAKEPEKRNFSVSNQSEEFQRVLNQSKFRLAHKSTYLFI